VCRILIVEPALANAEPPAATQQVAAGAGAASPAPAAVPTAKPSIGERLVGQISIDTILFTIEPRVPMLRKFQDWLMQRSEGFDDLSAEIHALLDGWRDAFGDALGNHANERAAALRLTPELLRRWFGDSMLQHPVHIADLQRGSVVDLLRLLDYPNDYVPVSTRRASENSPALEVVELMDKKALNEGLARSYLLELKDRARIV
jgi:hypothetical protein